MKKTDVGSMENYIISQWTLVNHLYDFYGIELPFESIIARNFRALVKPGDWVVDIGAHSGLHTGALLEAVGGHGRVAAFEPLPYFCGIVKDKFSNIKNIEIYNMALSNFDGEANFIVAKGTPEESGLRKKLKYIYPEKADLEEVRVDVGRLDTVLSGWSRLDYMKIDIEGAELDCLDGCVDLLSRFRPVISFECGYSGYGQYEKVSDDFVHFANRNEMNIYDILGNKITDMFDSVVDRAHVWDFYYVPFERSPAFELAMKHRPLP